MKVALCTIAKMENRYIKEYVSYYKNLGVDVIYLYDNNDVDGERFEQVIDKEIHDGSVVLLDYRGRKKCQVEAYQNCYEKYDDTKNIFNGSWFSYFKCRTFCKK